MDKTKSLLYVFACTLFIGFVPSCKKGSTVNKEIRLENAEHLLEFLNLLNDTNVLNTYVSSYKLNYYYKDEKNKLWIINLKKGAYGFADAKIAANLKDGRLSMIIASYNYDISAYVTNNFATYTGTTSIFNEHLEKIADFEYAEGKLNNVKRYDSPPRIWVPIITPTYTNWCLVYPPICDYSGGSSKPAELISFLPEYDPSGGANGSAGGITAYDPNHPFANLESPVDAADEPLINNSITVNNVNNYIPTGEPRIIATTANRNHTEDLLSETNADDSGVLSFMLSKSDEELFDSMEWLFDLTCALDGDLRGVGNLMIQKFRNKTGGSFENNILNDKVAHSNSLINFCNKFGELLKTQLQIAGGNIDNVGKIDLGSIRPIFNGGHNKFNGLQIIINDTEYTEIQLDDFHIDWDGKRIAIVSVAIHDHFGLDKEDVLSYQYSQVGFAAWWILQHKRAYVPFETIIHARKQIEWYP